MKRILALILGSLCISSLHAMELPKQSAQDFETDLDSTELLEQIFEYTNCESQAIDKKLSKATEEELKKAIQAYTFLADKENKDIEIARKATQYLADRYLRKEIAVSPQTKGNMLKYYANV